VCSIYILVSLWLIINLFTRDKSNTMTGVTTIYTIIYTIYTIIHKYTHFYVHIHEILVRKIIKIVNTMATSIQLAHFVISSLPIRLVRGGISQPQTRTRTPRETGRDRFHYRSTNNVHTNFMYSQVGHIYTVNNKTDNIQFTRASIQLREFIELCPYANVCIPSSRV